MKKVLITGQSSYVGNSFKTWVQKYYSEEIQVETVGMRSREWEKISLNKFDVVLHVAGIAHIRENDENREMYYQINRDLAVEVAKKAKKEGVKHYIFLSSMSVFGLNSGTITSETKLKPLSAYGKSKLEAEKILSTLSDSNFVVQIVRPPMIYGYQCKGNYNKLSRAAHKYFYLFPSYKNIRSMIYIDNLSEFIAKSILLKVSGYHHPQNQDFMSTETMVHSIRKCKGKKTVSVPYFDRLISTIVTKFVIMEKLFGNLVYSKQMSEAHFEYIVVRNNFESIQKSELSEGNK